MEEVVEPQSAARKQPCTCGECRTCRTREWQSRYYLAHKKEYREGFRKWYAANPGKERARQLRRKYGISPEEYDQRLEAQGGVCACCGEPETLIDKKTGLPKLLEVDHNHETGAVRDLLCHACNTAEGHLRTPERAEALAAYMRKHAPRFAINPFV